MQEEVQHLPRHLQIFGPLLPILTVANFDAALRYVKDHEKPLGAYIFTKDQNKVFPFR